MVAEEGETPVRGLSDEEIQTYDQLNFLMRRAGWRELDQAQQELTIRSDYALYAAIAQLENANNDLRGTPIATMLEAILESNQANYSLDVRNCFKMLGIPSMKTKTPSSGVYTSLELVN